eukprot:10017305-Ditylum_brightwellii.AAC.1
MSICGHRFPSIVAATLLSGSFTNNAAKELLNSNIGHDNVSAGRKKIGWVTFYMGRKNLDLLLDVKDMSTMRTYAYQAHPIKLLRVFEFLITKLPYCTGMKR